MTHKFSKSNTFFKSHSGGFTLLEMIISLGIFSIVAVIAVGSLVRITGLNRQAQSLQSAMNNVNFALEAISREMRFGSKYYCEANVSFNSTELSSLSFGACNNKTTDPTVIAFKSSELSGSGPSACHLVYAYWFSGGDVKKDQQRDCNDSISMAEASNIIDTTNVTLTGHSLSVVQGTRGHSWVKINIVGYAGKKENEKSNFDVRTGISQRIAD